MKILFKHIFKNIWAHKLRTIMLVVCIAICSFTAMICFDMSGSLDVMIRSVYSSIAGSADMEMVNRTAITEDFDKDHSMLPLNASPEAMIRSKFLLL